MAINRGAHGEYCQLNTRKLKQCSACNRQATITAGIILGYLKSALRSTYHAIRSKYAQRYLSEFQYRFNRRFDLREMISSLIVVALRTPPVPKKDF